MKNNLEIYNRVASVPEEAKKKITGGKLSGKTDINPMWRIRTLTEEFGPCGIGWYTEVKDRWQEAASTGEVKTFVEINLFVKVNGEWSRPICGIGGSSFVSSTKNGLDVSDECYKMAYTDAISVACKALGVGANVYWEAGETKYSRETAVAANNQGAQQAVQYTPEQYMEWAKQKMSMAKSSEELKAIYNEYKPWVGGHVNELVVFCTECNKRL